MSAKKSIGGVGLAASHSYLPLVTPLYSHTHRGASHRVSLLSDNVVQRQWVLDGVAFPLQEQQQVLSPGPQLHLQVLVVLVEEEHLHHWYTEEDKKTMVTTMKTKENNCHNFHDAMLFPDLDLSLKQNHLSKKTECTWYLYDTIFFLFVRTEVTRKRKYSSELYWCLLFLSFIHYDDVAKKLEKYCWRLYQGVWECVIKVRWLTFIVPEAVEGFARGAIRSRVIVEGCRHVQLHASLREGEVRWDEGSPG